ncbi:MAG: hypothetical protein FWD17_11190 [Polyangiaceae bacterium]|nr:hypothetical protein [Polyangiaceae bacterium]
MIAAPVSWPSVTGNITLDVVDAMPSETAADLSVTVDWGDSTTSSGMLTGGPGSFTLSAARTYDRPGLYTVTVMVADPATQASGQAVMGVTAGAVTYDAFNTAENITAGPDGNIWVLIPEDHAVGRITPDGGTTEFPFPMPSNEIAPGGIAAGGDGNVWFTDGDRVGSIAPDGGITEYPVPDAGGPISGITLGSDGNMWFTETYAGQIGQVTASGINEFPIPLSYAEPDVIVTGPDGNLWFTDYAYRVGSITPNGVVEQYTLSGNIAPGGIVAGPDGNLWFTELGTSAVGQITPSGTITTLALSEPGGAIAVGPDGNVWLTLDEGQSSATSLVQMTDAGVKATFPLPFAVIAMTASPNGTMWFVGGSGVSFITP